jgi:hypothetical protein
MSDTRSDASREKANTDRRAAETTLKMDSAEREKATLARLEQHAPETAVSSEGGERVRANADRRDRQVAIMKGEAAEREKANLDRLEQQAKTKPTPTQLENDLAASGVPVPVHEDDGSGPDPRAPKPPGASSHAPNTRHVEARPGGEYTTRAVSKACNE